MTEDRHLDPGPHEYGDSEVIRSAWTQMGTFLAAIEGPELRIVAWNETARSLAAAHFGGLGASVSDSAVVTEGGIDVIMRRVLETGEPFFADSFRGGLDDPDGEMRDHYFDLRYSRWLHEDGTPRGVLVHADEVSAGELAARQEEQEQREQTAAELTSTHEAISVLQSALLPDAVPVLPTVHVGARYLVAHEGSAAGGDWFASVVLPDGRVARSGVVSARRPGRAPADGPRERPVHRHGDRHRHGAPEGHPRGGLPDPAQGEHGPSTSSSVTSRTGWSSWGRSRAGRTRETTSADPAPSNPVRGA